MFCLLESFQPVHSTNLSGFNQTAASVIIQAKLCLGRHWSNLHEITQQLLLLMVVLLPAQALLLLVVLARVVLPAAQPE